VRVVQEPGLTGEAFQTEVRVCACEFMWDDKCFAQPLQGMPHVQVVQEPSNF